MSVSQDTASSRGTGFSSVALNWFRHEKSHPRVAFFESPERRLGSSVRSSRCGRHGVRSSFRSGRHRGSSRSRSFDSGSRSNRSFFLLAASSQGGNGDQGSQQERLVHECPRKQKGSNKITGNSGSPLVHARLLLAKGQKRWESTRHASTCVRPAPVDTFLYLALDYTGATPATRGLPYQEKPWAADARARNVAVTHHFGARTPIWRGAARTQPLSAQSCTSVSASSLSLATSRGDSAR